jgi:hypothetical protein
MGTMTAPSRGVYGNTAAAGRMAGPAIFKILARKVDEQQIRYIISFGHLIFWQVRGLPLKFADIDGKPEI